jgi:peptidoglycan hydrolase CwlO-like protein
MAAVLMAVFLPLGARNLPVVAGPWERFEADRQAITGGINQTSSEADRVLSELFNLGLEMQAAREDLAVIQAEMQSVAASLGKAAEELAKLESQLAERQRLLERRIRFIYEDGTVSYLEVLLSASSFQDLLDRMDLLRLIAAKDAALVKEISTLKAVVGRERAALQARGEDLAKLRSRAEARQAKITRLIVAREERLRALQDKRAFFEDALANLERVWALEAVPVLKALTAEFQGSTNRTWDLEPDQIRYRAIPPGVIFSISEATFNRFLQGGGPEIESLRLRITSLGAELSGNYLGVDLVLKGRVGIEGGTRIRFLPDAIIFSDFQASPEAVRLYVESLRMEIELAEFVRPARLTRIEMKDGLLEVETSLR